ncbi:hypothetical protein [Chitinophaga sp. CF418]|nr:hypothetical protein [Chitinophaga sp. CF418]SHN28297.1 hypothetical protein SAMN05216311_10884 [Chitinophaga sp. CF418]
MQGKNEKKGWCVEIVVVVVVVGVVVVEVAGLGWLGNTAGFEGS